METYDDFYTADNDMDGSDASISLLSWLRSNALRIGKNAANACMMALSITTIAAIALMLAGHGSIAVSVIPVIVITLGAMMYLIICIAFSSLPDGRRETAIAVNE